MARYKQTDDAQWQLTPINFEKLFPVDHPIAQLLATILRLNGGYAKGEPPRRVHCELVPQSKRQGRERWPAAARPNRLPDYESSEVIA